MTSDRFINKPIYPKWIKAIEIPEKKYVVSKLGLAPGAISILHGYSNVGKTFFAANLAVCVANNIPIFDSIPIDEPGPVLHIDWELNPDDCYLYYWRIHNGYNLNTMKNWGYMYPEWKLNKKEAIQNLKDILPDFKLCIIDCLGASIPTIDINDDRVRSFIDNLNAVSAETKCAILMLHHEPKHNGGDPLKMVKGNGSIIAAAGGSISLYRKDKEDFITMTIGKKRQIKDLTIQYKLEDCGEYCDRIKTQIGIKLVKNEKFVQTLDSLKTEILQIIKNSPGISKKKIEQEISGFSTSTIYLIIDNLIKDKLVEVEIYGQTHKHSLTSAGNIYLDWSPDDEQWSDWEPKHMDTSEIDIGLETINNHKSNGITS